MSPQPVNVPIPQASQNLLHSLAAQAEHEWGDFTNTVNGRVLVESPEIPREQAVKNAFIFGSIMAHTASIGGFIQAGMTAHLLPNRRIVWKLVSALQLVENERLPSLLFISETAQGLRSLYHGWASCVRPHPEFSLKDAGVETECPFATTQINFYTDLGGTWLRAITGVVAWVEIKDVIATFSN